MCYKWSVVEVASRELRNDTRGLLRRVEAAEGVVITVDGRRVAVLRPIGSRRGGIHAVSSCTVSQTAKPMPPLRMTSVSWPPTRPTTCVEPRHSRHQSVHRRGVGANPRRGRPPDELAISVITIGELHTGVLAAVDVETHDRRLATLSEALALDPLPVDQAVAEAWARLRVLFHDMQRHRCRSTTPRSPATAMSLAVPVVTQEDEDYVEVAGLKIVRV